MIPLLLAFFFAPQDQPLEKCTISGVVVNSITGEPLNRVQVLADRPGNRDAAPASTVTGAKGEFTLVQLEPGQYRLKGVRNGYLETYYGAKRAETNGITLTLEAGQESKDLQLKLLPFAVIAGTVRDPEGEPVARATVALSSVSYRDGRQRVTGTGEDTTTDDLGHYRIVGLAPGRYYIRAGLPIYNGKMPVDHSPKGASPPEVLVPTFYPASRDLSGARRIEVTAGARFTGADITLLRSRVYRVRVQAEGPAGLGLGVSLQERPHLGDGLTLNPPPNCQHGICEFAGVPSGAYEVTVSASQRDRRGTFEELFFNSHEYRTSVPVEVVNADVEGVHVVLNPGAEIAGRITIAGEEHPVFAQTRVSFVFAEGDDGATVASDGSFTSRLSQGRYEVRVFTGTDLIVRSIRSDDTDVLQEGLTVAHPGKMPLEIVMARDGGKIDGTVLDKDDKPAAGGTVVLMPEGKLRSRHDLYQQTETDQYGRFQFKTVAPGDYQLFAWDDVEPGIWFDPDFMKDIERRGEAVSVHAKGAEQARLHLLP